MSDATARQPTGLRSYKWSYAYKTSAVTGDGRQVDILYDFYIPALKRAVRYDRMAGYFRSTSLAAASQGFSAFVGRNGHMRLIVGADMEPDDVLAILKGDTAHLTQQLNKELDGRPGWPKDVAHGVELLAWMVAHGYLEVRVAFRVHGKNGDPIAFNSMQDGYVHEKWAVFADEHNNRLYVSGSLNESKTALTLNAENIDVHCDWWGEREQQRIADAENDFNAIWNNHNPFLRVMPLPEAVQKKLIAMSESVMLPTEIDGSSAAPREVTPPSTLERLQFAMLKDGPRLPRGRYVGIETAPIAPWPHQAVVARRLVETWPYNHLLCDEVGLGKTIEAGLAIRALHLSGLVKRVLITAPRSLTRQWQREMATKFLLSFGRALSGPGIRHHYEFPFEEEQSSPSLYSPNLAIVSTGLLSRQERLADLNAAPKFDVVLVDEAHYARRKNPTRGTRVHPQYGNLFRAVEGHLASKARSLWLATATPMQLDAVEVSDLLQLTNRVGAFQFDPTLMQQYYEILGTLVHDGSPTVSQWEFLRRAVTAVQRQDPLLWQFVDLAVIDGRIRMAVRQWLEQGRVPRGPDLKSMLRLVFAASPLSRTMLRHTRPLLEIYRERGQLGANLATRKILPVPKIVLNNLEKKAYEELEEYCDDLVEQIAAHSDNENKNTVGFMLSFLRLRFASSLFAIRETLRRRREKVEATLSHLLGDDDAASQDFEAWQSDEDDEEDREAVTSILKNRTPEDLEWEKERLGKMLLTLEDVSGASSKMQVLFGVLEKRRIPGTGRVRQTVIFTRFFDTLTDIVDRLHQVDDRLLIGTYSGQGGQYTDPQAHRLVGVERDEVKHRFLRDEIDVLVCTDAAAEGLNLQTADLLINFDLPWNPMKVEQRIGRIDRIGQKHEEIFVLNLCYADSAEQKVYDRLLTRLVQAGSIVGTQQISMLPVTMEEFDELAAGKLDEHELERRAKERIALFRQRTASMEIPPRDLYEIYSRLAADSSSRPSPVTLDSLWTALAHSRYLRDLGCLVNADQQLFTIRGVNEAPDKTVLTNDRNLYETGVVGLEGRLHFASYGGAVFDAVVRQVTSFSLPSCIRRLVGTVEGVDAELVGYAVAAVDDDGTRTIRLLTSLDDALNVRVDEGAELVEEEIAPLQRQLNDLAAKEFAPALMADRFARINRRAGHAQVALDYLVVGGLIEFRRSMVKDGDLFWQVAKDLETLLEERDQISVAGLPADSVRRISDLLLFETKVPTIGNEASLTASTPLLRAAFDAGCRVADSLKEKKAELRTDAVLARLRREIERELAEAVKG